MAGQWGLISEETVSNRNLAVRGKIHGLHQCIILHPTAGRLVADRPLATTVKAIIGAVKLDGGNAAAELLLSRLEFTHDLLVSLNCPSSSCKCSFADSLKSP